MAANIYETEITSRGIQKILNKFTPERAIAEYVWNGFDANATDIHISITSSELNIIEKITIQDNGTGIDFNTLDTKFKIFMESKKTKKSEDGHRIKGKNGSGRLTFFKLASDARWDTVYTSKNKNYEYSIKISVSDLKKFSQSEKTESKKQTGTLVTLDNITLNDDSAQFEKSLKKYLIAEFSWFLELNKNRKIFINGEELEYDDYIGDKDEWTITVNNHTFIANYFRWNGKLNDEFSRFYYLNDEGELVHQETTKLNKKGDNFYHTVIIKNSFYNEIQLDDIDDPNLFTTEEEKQIQKELENQLNEELKKKRKPFLHEKAMQWVQKAEESGTFPKFGSNSWDNARKESLASLVTEFYEVEPQIFITLTKNQQKVLLALLNLIMDKNGQEDLFTILEEIVDLEDYDREVFASILRRTKLKNVIDMSNLIKDRLDTLENLKQLVFNHELNATERDHLQRFIENHYWIFGEEYRLVCAEEVKFEEALKRYKYILLGINEDEYIEHPDKYKEMDLFITGTEFKNDYPQNIVIEIKNPTTIKKLTDKEFSQIKKYIAVIRSVDEFNSNSSEWTFILVGQDYDATVGMEIKDKRTGLAIEQDNFKLYVKKWSDIINDVTARLHYLEEKLQLQKKNLIENPALNTVMEEIQDSNNSAKMPAEIII